MASLKGKNVLVTGATGGLGQAICEALFEMGAILHLSGRSLETLSLLKERFQGHIWPADLADQASLKEMVSRIEESFGSVDILINNAGMTKDGLAMRMSEEDFQSVLNVNLTSAFVLSKQVLRGMLKKKWGRIINISSVVAFSGNPGQANYCASKAGLVGMTKAMALEAARYNVTINAIAPGFIKTQMTDHIPEVNMNQLIERIPMQKVGLPEDIAYFVQVLVDPRSSYMTGQTLHVNGGLYLS